MKRHLSEIKANLYVVGVLLLALFIFLAWFFHAWPGAEIASQMFAAIAGAVVAAFITAILLRLQARSQGEQEKESKVYEEKLRIYQDFLHKLNEIIRDKKIDEEEVIDLQFQVSYIDMHTSSEHIKTISEHVANIVKNINNPDDDFNLLQEMFSINDMFRAELYPKEIEKKNSHKNILDFEKEESNRQNAVDNFKSIVVYEKGNSLEYINVYERIIQLKQIINADDFRQWIYGKRTLVHELYLNYNGYAFRKEPWENSICCDSIFDDDGTIHVILFIRKSNRESTEQMLKDDIWKTYQGLFVEENGRCEIKTFGKEVSDKDIKDFFENNLLPKMKQWREIHKEEYIMD